jgi:hypothetical protein
MAHSRFTPHSARMSWTALGRAGEARRSRPAGSAGDDLNVHAVFLAFARIERPIGGVPVRWAGECRRARRTPSATLRERLVRASAPRRQGGRRRRDVLAGRGRAHAEPGCELGVGMAVAQVVKGEQRPSAGAHRPHRLPIARRCSCRRAAGKRRFELDGSTPDG